MQRAAKPKVFRKYSGNKGLKADFEKTANQNPDITKLVTIGQTIEGQDIVALKVSEDADTTADGAKPSVLYLGAQHAREWITPEMIRRLKNEIIKRYTTGNNKDRAAPRGERAVVRAGRQPGWLRLHLRAGSAPVA